MRKEIIVTADGSSTVKIAGSNITYHSIHGAIQESKHVFIEAGLNYCLSRLTSQSIDVFEMGLGTGLNALLSAIEAERLKVKINYTAVELFPLSAEEAGKLNYSSLLPHADLFQKIHRSEWEKDETISQYFTLRKEKTDLQKVFHNNCFDLIYYDAFAPGAQPELWTKEIFENLFQMLRPGGVLVTYCSKGDVRRAMIAAGFTVEKLKGPPRKREMLRATKS